MIDIKNIKAVSCFNINEYEENYTKIKVVQFNENDDLNYCYGVPCCYWASSKEIAKTIKNVPPIEVGLNQPFPDFEVKTFQTLDDDIPKSIIQRTFFYGKEWRRWYWYRKLNWHQLNEEYWGEWIPIDDIIDYILKNDNTQNFTKKWDQYMIIDENNIKNRKWVDNTTTIDKIIEEIKTGTAKVYLNKIVKNLI